ncbi:MAG TPA: hypothetical protein VL549_03870 [Gemmatimonadales bacterium]|jgi:hypothetical protein|nr:hypothetical protein [Gemmatimonadales bacterium]
MIRKVLLFAVLAVAAVIVIKVAFALLGMLIGLVVTVLVLAALGYFFYLLLRVVSPKTADRVQQIIRGRPTPT